MILDETFEISAPMKARYLERRREDVTRCQAALIAGDFATIETVGHRLKGNGISFDYPELSILGASIETAAKASDPETLTRLLADFATWVATVAVQCSAVT